MRYSLVNRFQGVLLGAILGELIGIGCVGQTQPERQRSLLGGVTERLRKGQSHPVAKWSCVAVLGVESLVRHGRLDIEDWNHQLSLQEFMPMLRVAGGHEVAIGTLPITLFSHENKIKRQQALEQVLHSWQGRISSTISHILAYAITQALQERLNPATLISQTLAQIQYATDLETATIVPLLLQVQQLLQQGAGLSAVASLDSERVDEAALALAYYCFLSTPDYPALALLKAAQTSQPQPVCALVGALIGAYHGVAGFPAAWRLSFTQETIPASSGEFLTSSSTILHLGDRLFATWCGTYNPATTLLSSATAVAAPGVINPRL